MKIKYFLISCFFVQLAAFNGKAQVALNFENLKSDSLLVVSVLVSNRTDEEHIDTVQLINHKLLYTFKFSELREFAIIPFSLIHQFKNGNKYSLPGSRIKFFAMKGDKIEIIAKINGHSVSYETKGNALSFQFALSHVAKLKLFEERYVNEIIANQKSGALLSEDEKKKVQLDRIENNRKYEAENLKFANAHPDYVIAPRLLLEVNDKDNIIRTYAKLTNSVKESYFGKLVGENIESWMASKVGKQMLNFEGTTIQGKGFQLNELKGKFVLLDFWGSWCGPCLTEIPSLKSLERTNSANLAIVGLICKDEKSAALNAINKYKITTTQLYSDKINYGKLFGIRDYPSKILLDKNGVVIKTFTGYSEANFKEIQSLINQ